MASKIVPQVFYRILNSTISSGASTSTIGGSQAWVCGAISFYQTDVSAIITGTATASIDETDIVAGGKTIIITLTGDTFISS